MRNSLGIASVAVVLTLCWCGQDTRGEMRTWRAAVGSYTAEGEFISLKPSDVVSLRLKDGTVRDIPLDKLCDEDKAYVRSLNPASQPAAPKAAAPAATGPLQSVEEADKAMKAVDKEAQRSRTAEEAVMLWGVFLAENTLPPTTRSAAELKKAEWQQLADKGLVRSGNKWVTPDEVRAGKLKSFYLINQGLELVRLKQDRLAYEKLMEASQAAPDDIYADFIIATVYAIGIHKYDKAEDHYEICLRRDPGNPAVLNNLALTEVKVGRHSEAVQHWRAAAAACEDPRITQNLGRMLDQAGQGKLLVSKQVLRQISDVYASLVIAKNVTVAKSQLGFRYMLIPQEPPPDESAAVVPRDSTLDTTTQVCGTGFVISKEHVLTTRASTKGSGDFLIADPIKKGEFLTAKLVASSKTTEGDFAILHCPDLKARPLPCEPRLLVPGDEVVVAGYPLVDTTGVALKLAKGSTLAAAAVGRLSLMTYEAPNSPTVAGGPVVDSMGNAVAMHLKTSASLNNRYGLGIPMTTVLPFVLSSLTAYEPTPVSKVDLPAKEIEEEIRQATVVVLTKTPAEDCGLSKRVGEGFLIDPYCCRCNGNKTIDCLARKCVNGKIVNTRTVSTGRLPTGETMTEDQKYYTACPACNGDGRMRCPACGGTGLDRP
jgi:tetratricopeptide (TPR) repeat protein